MGEEFHKYRIARVLSVRKLSTAHFLPKITHFRNPPHKHSSWEFVFCEHGRVTARTDAEQYVLGRSQILFHSPGHEHCFEVGEEETTLFVMSFVCTSKCMKLFRNDCMNINGEQRQLLSLIIQELYNAFELSDGKLLLGDFHPNAAAPLGSEQMVSGYLEALLISLLRSKASQRGMDWDTVGLGAALEDRIAHDIRKYISEHIHERITLEDLARHFHYSRSYITAQFRSSTGMSVMEYISELRIEQAKRLLRDGEMTISQIASSLGYSSLQYFSQRFKQTVGCCPSEYVDRQDPFST